MNERRKAETVEKFKLRITSIIRGNVLPAPDEFVAGPSKEATPRTFTEVRPGKDKPCADLISDTFP